MKVNYYEVLGVERSATDQQIRDQFRKLARESHPDRHRGSDKAEAERKFQMLTEAVNVLTNPGKRKQHDAELSAGLAGRPTVDFAQIAKAYLNKGTKALNEKDFATAYENFDMAVKHNQNDAKAHHYLAITARRLRSKERQAVQEIEAAVRLEPMNPVYLRDAGLICQQAGLTAKAERYLEEALKWDSENPEIQAALAQLREPKEAARSSFSIFGKR
jgi:DnaJ-class molecular chaperone